MLDTACTNTWTGGVILIPCPPDRGNSTVIRDKECTDSRLRIVFILRNVVAQQH
jgi:hypothetical protein